MRTDSILPATDLEDSLAAVLITHGNLRTLVQARGLLLLHETLLLKFPILSRQLYDCIQIYYHRAIVFLLKKRNAEQGLFAIVMLIVKCFTFPKNY